MEAKAPKIGINVARDLFRAVREVATQLLRGILAVALKKRSPGREAESLDFPVEFGEQEGFTFAQEEELLDTAPIVLREIVAEFSVQRLRLLESGEPLIGNEKAVIALEKIRDDENFIARGQQLSRFEPMQIGRGRCRCQSPVPRA